MLSPNIPDMPDITDMLVHKACEVVLRTVGKPLSTGQLVNFFEKVGYGQHLKDLRNATYTAMDRRKDDGQVFRKVAPGVWGLREWDERET